jgi:hypothetical protein
VIRAAGRHSGDIPAAARALGVAFIDHATVLACAKAAVVKIKAGMARAERRAARVQSRPSLDGLAPPCRSRVAGDSEPAIPISAHGREIECRDVIDHGTRDWRDGCVHQNTATASAPQPGGNEIEAFTIPAARKATGNPVLAPHM